MLALCSTVSVSMAQYQHVSNSGAARPQLRRVKRQLPAVNHDAGIERSSKRTVRNQDVNVRRSLANPNMLGRDGHRLSRSDLKYDGSSRAMRKGVSPHSSRSVSNCSDVATICSTEDRMNEVSSPTWSTSQSSSSGSSRQHDFLDIQPLERTGSELSYAGSWADGEPIESSGPELDIDDWDPEHLCEMPHAPELGRLATPQLSPLPGDVGFCHCCKSEAADDDEGRRINEIYRLSHRDKADVQLEWALAYMDRTMRGATRQQ